MGVYVEKLIASLRCDPTLFSTFLSSLIFPDIRNQLQVTPGARDGQCRCHLCNPCSAFGSSAEILKRPVHLVALNTHVGCEKGCKNTGWSTIEYGFTPQFAR